MATAEPITVWTYGATPTTTVTVVVYTSTKLLGYGACGPHATTTA
jgi:hypothetical protein